MADPNNPDPGASDADKEMRLAHKLSQVNARIIGRLHEVGRRIEKAKGAMDLANVIRTHPLKAAGVSLALGALMGLARKRS